MRLSPLFLGVALIAPAISHAEIQFNGFLSAIGGQATDEPVRGYEDSFVFNQDSIFGLQARADLSDKLSMTGQLVSRGADDYATELAWGFLSYDVNNKLSLRMGRFRTPFYFYSDFIEVGYAYPWIAPADEVYALQFDNIDGVDAIFKTPIAGDLNAEFQLYAGSIDEDYILDKTGQALETKTRGHVGFATTFSYGDFSIRGSIHNAELTAANFDELTLGDTPITIGMFKASLQQTADDTPALAPLINSVLADLEIDTVNTTFTQAGIKYDGEYVFLVSELTNLSFDEGPVAEQNRFHVSGGVNLGNTTVFVNFAEADDDAVDLNKGLGQIDEAAGAVLDGISETLSITSETIGAGIRYDFDAGAAIKLQYDNITTPGIDGEDESNGLLRFGVDLVF